MAQENTRKEEVFRATNTDRTTMKVKLDVGGTIFSTSIATLTTQPNSMLAAMFSGRFPLEKDEDGTYFIDRDPKLFAKILDYLRTGRIPEVKNESEAARLKFLDLVNTLRTANPRMGIALHLVGCDLRGFCFATMKLDNAVFAKSDLSGADFWNTELRNVDFRQCKLIGTNFSQSHIDGTVNFSDADCSDANFSELEFQRGFGPLQFYNTDLNGAEFGESNIFPKEIPPSAKNTEYAKNIVGKQTSINVAVPYSRR